MSSSQTSKSRRAKPSSSTGHDSSTAPSSSSTATGSRGGSSSPHDDSLELEKIKSKIKCLKITAAMTLIINIIISFGLVIAGAIVLSRDVDLEEFKSLLDYQFYRSIFDLVSFIFGLIGFLVESKCIIALFMLLCILNIFVGLADIIYHEINSERGKNHIAEGKFFVYLVVLGLQIGLAIVMNKAINRRAELEKQSSDG